MTTLTVKEIRENGIGNGFTVLDPSDGFRKDNTIWFGKCAECGGRVTNSVMTEYKWKHSSMTFANGGNSGMATMKEKETCF